MNGRQYRTYDSLKRSFHCLGDPRFHVPRILSLRADLGRAIERVEALVNDQNTVVETRGFRAKRLIRLERELREAHLKRISKRGKVILYGDPGIKDLLRLPRKHITVLELLDGARRIFDTVRPYTAEFVQAGFPEDFLEQAELASGAVAECWASPADGDTRRARATAALPRALALGRAVVDALTSEISVELATDGAALSEWEKASRVGARMGRPRKRNAPAQSGAISTRIDGAARALEVTT